MKVACRMIPSMVMALCIVMLLSTIDVLADPFVPEHDAQVLESVPAVMGELRRLRARAATTDDGAAQIALARQYITIGRAEADPRYYGYAQSVLSRWDEAQGTPAEVYVLRAILHQSRHDFVTALNDLDKAVALEPHNIQAWLTRAMLLRVRGDYPQAMQSCLRLAGRAQTLITTACVTSISGMLGRSASSGRLLETALSEEPEADIQVRLWAVAMLADLAASRGDAVEAERHFAAARALEVRNVSLLASYADFLLDHGRAEPVRQMLGDETQSDALLLRLALAETRLKLPSASDHVAMLAERISENRQRGDRSHLREEARVMLHLLHDDREALQLARRNWEVQREAWDARLLLEAALAVNDREAARPVLEWIDQTGIEDVHLSSLARQYAGSGT